LGNKKWKRQWDRPTKEDKPWGYIKWKRLKDSYVCKLLVGPCRRTVHPGLAVEWWVSVGLPTAISDHGYAHYTIYNQAKVDSAEAETATVDFDVSIPVVVVPFEELEIRQLGESTSIGVLKRFG